MTTKKRRHGLRTYNIEIGSLDRRPDPGRVAAKLPLGKECCLPTDGPDDGHTVVCAVLAA